MMNVKLGTIVAAESALLNLSREKNISANVSYEIMEFLDIVLEEAQSYKKILNKKVMDMGSPAKDENGNEIPNQFTVLEENKVLFLKELEELLERSVEINCPVIMLSKIEGAKISPSDMSLLKWIIKK